MMRLQAFFGAFCLCALVAGCSSENYDGLVSETIQMIQNATTKVENIKIKVDEAVKRAEAGQKLDLSEAVEATKQLTEAGNEAQKLKRRIELVRAKVTDEDKKLNVQKHQGSLNQAFADLLKKKEELRNSLADAEKLGGNAKQAVKDFRETLVAAESPFEALSR